MILKVIVVEATGCMKGDPYVQLRIGRTTRNTKTSTISHHESQAEATQDIQTLEPSLETQIRWNDAQFQFRVSQKQYLDPRCRLSVALRSRKDFFKVDSLGSVNIALTDLSNEWYPLSSNVMIRLKLCWVGKVNMDLRSLSLSLMEDVAGNAALVESDDPSDEVFFNHTFEHTFNSTAEQQPTLEIEGDQNLDNIDLEAGGESPEKSGSGSGSDKGDTDLDLDLDLSSKESDAEIDDKGRQNELSGILLLDIKGARNLPFEKSKLRTFNCDPFVVITFGKKIFRTKLVKHSLNPEWNQYVHLHLKKSDLDKDWPLSFCIFDFERFRRNNSICQIDTKLKLLLDECKPSTKTGHTISFPSVEMSLDLKITNTKANQGESDAPKLIVSCSFIPYVEMRRNFWISLLTRYESEVDSEIRKIEKVAFVTLLDGLESTWSDERIDAMFKKDGKEISELSFEEVIESFECKMVEDDKERITMIKVCPHCKKNLNLRGDFDVISHLSLCTHNHSDTLDQLAMGGFLTIENASSKWLTKVVSYVTFGGMAIGKNNAHILYQDRVTGQLVKEKIPTYIRLGIRLLYQVAGSKSAVESKAIKKLLRNMTLKQGIKFESPASVKNIAQFVAYHNLDLDEVLDPISSFRNFNEFFYRKLKKGARVLGSTNKDVMICPADARTNCFPSIQMSQDLWIKGSKFSLASLLGDTSLATDFNEGSIAIFRLAPQDYHRFHFPVDGTLESSRRIEGFYYTVNPMAVRTSVDVFTENVRQVSIIKSERHGRVAIVSVGAMLVGSIEVTAKVGQDYKRMDELGYFKFGGSTIIVIFEKGKVSFDDDLLLNSKQSLETLVKMGNCLGTLTL